MTEQEEVAVYHELVNYVVARELRQVESEPYWCSHWDALLERTAPGIRFFAQEEIARQVAGRGRGWWSGYPNPYKVGT